MPESDASHSGDGRRLRRVTASLVGLVLVAAGAAYLLDADERLGTRPDPVDEPAAIAPPPTLELPAASAAPVVAEPLAGGELDPADVRRALRGLLDDPRVGRLSVTVADLVGDAVLTRGPKRFTPASITKIVTSLAALEALGTEHRFTTSTSLAGRRLTLVGGGDPLLARQPVEPDETNGALQVADLRTLARSTARALRQQGVELVRLRYDAGLFMGPEVNPRWENDYVPDNVVSPITALWVDQGREREDTFRRVADPPRVAAQEFAAELRRLGVKVRGEPRAAVLPAGAEEVAAVSGAELAEVVQHVLEVSDNEGAEVLARHVALAEGEPASYVGGTRAIRQVLRRLGVPVAGMVLHDASGLARGNRLSADTVIAALAAASTPQLRGVLTGLPVAGFNGSLTYRFGDSAEEGLGRVRAKTGTLTGVHGLAGIVVGADDSVMLYVAVADRVAVEDTLFARDRLDEISAALAACACGR